MQLVLKCFQYSVEGERIFSLLEKILHYTRCDRFYFFLNDRFVLKTTIEKQKTIVLKNKQPFLKFVVSLTIFNDNPSL